MAPGPVFSAIIPRSPPPRTLLEEIANLPIVDSATRKVSAAHRTLCRAVPLYGRVTSAALRTAGAVARRAEERPFVRSSVMRAEQLGLRAVDGLRSSCPIVDKPTDEVLEKLCLKIRQRVQKGSSKVASFRIFQIACHATEAALSTAESACIILLLLEEAAAFTHLLPRRVKRLYILTVRPLLTSAERFLKNGRLAVKSWRRSGLKVRIAKECIKHRRKASPRKKAARPKEYGLFIRLLKWVLFGASTSRTLTNTGQMECIELLQSPNNKKKKRKFPEDDDTSDHEPEMTLRDLMVWDLSSYCSEDDSEYLPSETSSDSLEYRSTDDEEIEFPFTEDVTDRSVLAKGPSCPADYEESSAAVPRVVVTMIQDEEQVAQSTKTCNDNST